MTSPPPLEQRRPGLPNALKRFYRRRRYRIHVDAWGICIGVLAVWQLFLFAAYPAALEATSVSKVLGPFWDVLWTAGYGTAGACIIYGLVKPDSGIDALGLAVLAGAIAGQLACIAVAAPLSLAQAGPQLFTPCIAAIMRFRVVTGRVRPGPDDIPPAA